MKIKKAAKEKRAHVVGVRFTLSDYQKIQLASEATGLSNQKVIERSVGKGLPELLRFFGIGIGKAA